MSGLRDIAVASVAYYTAQTIRFVPLHASQEEEAGAPVDPTKFVAKKSKAAAKKGVGNSQWDILKMSNIPEAEIAQVGWRSRCWVAVCGCLFCWAPTLTCACAPHARQPTAVRRLDALAALLPAPGGARPQGHGLRHRLAPQVRWGGQPLLLASRDVSRTPCMWRCELIVLACGDVS